jgi:hypothetical protein
VTNAKKREVREIPFSQIEQNFHLAAVEESVAVGRISRPKGGYYIRVVMSMSTAGGDVTTKYGYFYLDADGTVISTPRGYAKDYKPGRVTGIEDARAKYAAATEDAGNLL